MSDHDLSKELEIDDSSYANLNTEFKEHSVKHSKWLVMAARLIKQLSTLRLRLKVLSAEIAEEYRQEYLKNTGKQCPVSFDIRFNIIPLNKDWVKLSEEIISTEEELDIAKAACDTFSERGYSLKEVAKYMEATSELHYKQAKGYGN